MSIRGTAATLGILLRSAPCAYLGRAVSSPNLASIVQLALPAARIRRMSPMVVGVDAIMKGFNLPTLVTLFGVRVLQYGPSGIARTIKRSAEDMQVCALVGEKLYSGNKLFRRAGDTAAHKGKDRGQRRARRPL